MGFFAVAPSFSHLGSCSVPLRRRLRFGFVVYVLRPTATKPTYAGRSRTRSAAPGAAATAYTTCGELIVYGGEAAVKYLSAAAAFAINVITNLDAPVGDFLDVVLGGSISALVAAWAAGTQVPRNRQAESAPSGLRFIRDVIGA